MKLTEEQVLQIYERDGSLVELAKEFGVSKSFVSHIKTGKNYSEITGANFANSNRTNKEPYNFDAFVGLVSQGLKRQEIMDIFIDMPKHTYYRMYKKYKNG